MTSTIPSAGNNSVIWCLRAESRARRSISVILARAIISTCCKRAISPSLARRAPQASAAAKQARRPGMTSRQSCRHQTRGAKITPAFISSGASKIMKKKIKHESSGSSNGEKRRHGVISMWRRGVKRDINDGAWVSVSILTKQPLAIVWWRASM